MADVLTVNALATELSIEFGHGSSNPDYIDKVEGWINQAFAEIVVADAWQWLRQREIFEVIQGDTRIGLHSNCLIATGGRIVASGGAPVNQPLVLMPMDNLQAFDQETQCRPLYLSNAGYDLDNNRNVVRMGPGPSDASYTLHIEEEIRPNRMASGDRIPMPPEFVALLKQKVRVYMATDDENYESVTAYGALYAQMLNDAQIHLKERTEDRSLSYSDCRNNAVGSLFRLPDGWGWW